jgi:hypothetical protein
MNYYYELGKGESVVTFIPYSTEKRIYSGTSNNKLMNKHYTNFVDGIISYVGFRIPKNGHIKKTYNETLTLQVPGGMLVASQVYDDPGNGIDTTLSNVTFMIHNAIGIFKGKKGLRIKYDNKHKRRMIEVF